MARFDELLSRLADAAPERPDDLREIANDIETRLACASAALDILEPAIFAGARLVATEDGWDEVWVRDGREIALPCDNIEEALDEAEAGLAYGREELREYSTVVKKFRALADKVAEQVTRIEARALRQLQDQQRTLDQQAELYKALKRRWSAL